MVESSPNVILYPKWWFHINSFGTRIPSRLIGVCSWPAFHNITFGHLRVPVNCPSLLKTITNPLLTKTGILDINMFESESEILCYVSEPQAPLRVRVLVHTRYFLTKYELMSLKQVEIQFSACIRTRGQRLYWGVCLNVSLSRVGEVCECLWWEGYVYKILYCEENLFCFIRLSRKSAKFTEQMRNLANFVLLNCRSCK